MEVCGTHTASIAHCGIVSLLSPKIELISGPGCPVCVTVTEYIDRLVDLCLKPDTVVVTFGDMIRVTGSHKSLSDVRSEGGQVRMVYAPLDILRLAAAEPNKTFVFAAIGFETTTAVYAALMDEMIRSGISNVRLLTSLKTMPLVIEWVCRMQGGIDGFLAPGHVSVITGSDLFKPLAAEFHVPFAVAGFEGEEILIALYALVKMIERGESRVMNMYPSAVTATGNEAAQKMICRYFKPCDAAWRGMGIIPGSGMVLKEQYSDYDAGSEDLYSDHSHHPLCCCKTVITGAMKPYECPLFGTLCTPDAPQGACMVSTEGSCYSYFVNRRNG
jgi:hydrogenase expression/formation protein HypD